MSLILDIACLIASACLSKAFVDNDGSSTPPTAPAAESAFILCILNSVNSKISLFLRFIILIYILKYETIIMKIKRFNEDEQVDISSERISEIMDELKDFVAIMEDKSKYVESLLNELNNYKSDSKKGNDQIDDSIAALQIVKKDVDDCNDKIDTIVNNLTDYNEGGRKYMYTENK